MTTFIVSYDLVKDDDYDALYAELKSTNNWAKITESTWAIVTDETASQVRNRLTKVMNSDGRVFVVKSGVQAAWRNVKCKNEWLKKRL